MTIDLANAPVGTTGLIPGDVAGVTHPVAVTKGEHGWYGAFNRDIPLTDLDLVGFEPLLTAQAAATIVEAQLDAFLDSPTLDRSWVAGWHSAVKHTASHVRRAFARVNGARPAGGVHAAFRQTGFSDDAQATYTLDGTELLDLFTQGWDAGLAEPTR